MTETAERAARVRRGAGWFARPDRGLVCVRGADRVRWTHGMLSNDVTGLAPTPTRSGCYALLLTPQGRIVADLHVLCRPEELWLDVAAEAIRSVVTRLERYVIADDVVLSDESAAWRRFAIEGPRAREILERAVGAPIAIAPDCGAPVPLAGVEVVVAAWGESGERAYQLSVPAAAAEAVSEAIARCVGSDGLEIGDASVLEVLRVEAGTPRLGSELGEDVLPAEAGLIGRAVDLRKGCYTGQEIVARMESRGSAAHRLVGFRFETAAGAEARAPVGTPVRVDGTDVGELTSTCYSQLAGEIGLGFVRRAHAAPGTPVTIGAARAQVAALPFVSGRP